MRNEQTHTENPTPERYAYERQIERAKHWLGDHYLLAKPVGQYVPPALLRKQAE